MRKPKESDFTVSVEDVGVFRFGHKSVFDQVKIEAEYARLTEGVELVPRFLEIISTAIAEIKVMASAVPDGWDLNDMDGEDGDNYDKIVKVRRLYREEVAKFRKGPIVPVPVAGASTGEGDGVLVSPEVPAIAQ